MLIYDDYANPSDKDIMADQSGKDLRAAGYIRVSTPSEAQKISIKQQRIDVENSIKNRIKSLGWTDTGLIYQDEGITGTTTYGREALKQMKKDLKDDKFDILIVREVSRLARNLLIFCSLLDLFERFGKIIYFMDANLRSDNPNHRMTLGMMAMVAEEESRQKSKYTRHAQEVKRNKGWVFGSNNRFGWDLVKTPREESNLLVRNDYEARVVQWIFDLYESGFEGKRMGCRNIAVLLNNEDIDKAPYLYPEDPDHEFIGRVSTKNVEKHKKDSPWSAGRVCQVLKNRCYCGYVCYNTSEKKSLTEKRRKNRNRELWSYVEPAVVNGKPVVDKIIDERQFDRVQDLMNSRKTVYYKLKYDKNGQPIRNKNGDLTMEWHSRDKEGNDMVVAGRNFAHSLWSRKLQCICGCSFKRHRVHRGQGKEKQKPYEYVCLNRYLNYKMEETRCNNKPFREDILYMGINTIFENLTDFPKAFEQAKKEAQQYFTHQVPRKQKEYDAKMREINEVETKMEKLLEVIMNGGNAVDFIIDKAKECEREKAELESELKVIERELDEINKSLNGLEQNKLLKCISSEETLYEDVDIGYQGIRSEYVDEFVKKVVVKNNYEFDWYIDPRGGCSGKDFRNKFNPYYKKERYSVPENAVKAATFQFEERDRKLLNPAFRVRRIKDENGELVEKNYKMNVYIVSE